MPSNEVRISRSLEEFGGSAPTEMQNATMRQGSSLSRLSRLSSPVMLRAIRWIFRSAIDRSIVLLSRAATRRQRVRCSPIIIDDSTVLSAIANR